jgi:hypothetical protein
MKATTLKKAALLAGSLSFLAGSAFSQTAVSGAGGYTTYNLGVGFNLIGISLFDPVIVSGTIDAEAGAVITDAGVDFTAALPTPTTTKYLIEILSGAQSGAVAEIASVDSATQITLDGPVGAGTADYQIRKAPLLGDIFGTTLQGGANAAAADVVWLPNGAGGFNQFFYSTVGNQFRSSAAPFGALPNGVPVFYPDGMFVQVKTTAKNVVVTGMVKTTGTVVAANTDFNLTAVNAPVGQTLGNSGLQSFLQSGPNAAGADVVWLTNGVGAFTQYFFSSVSSQWKLSSSAFGPDQGGVAMTSGIFIQRKGASTAGQLTVPAFYANL